MALAVVVLLQAAELLAATVASCVAIATAQPADRGSTIALAVTVALLFVGVGLLGWGVLAGRKRLLGAVLTWQFMEVAVAIGAFEGLLGPWWTGLLLLVPAIAGIVLSVIRPVMDVLGSRPRSEQADPKATPSARPTKPTPKRR